VNGNCLSIKTHQQTHKYYSYSTLLLTFIQFSIWAALPLSHTSILTAKTVNNVRKLLVQLNKTHPFQDYIEIAQATKTYGWTTVAKNVNKIYK